LTANDGKKSQEQTSISAANQPAQETKQIIFCSYNTIAASKLKHSPLAPVSSANS
jgi:hypothetical protein